MRKILALLALLLLVSPAYGQSVQQSGNITPGHVAGWTTNGVISDGGTGINPTILTGLGVVRNGYGICQQSDTILSGSYNRLCLYTTPTGAAISLDNVGSATGLLGFIVNGTPLAFPSIPLDGNDVNFIQAGTGAVNRLMQDKARDWLNAKDFGVVCNGSTVDATNINKAITAAASLGGPAGVRLPSGICAVDATSITMASNVYLVGAGKGQTTLKLTSYNPLTIIAGVSVSNSGVSDLTIDVNNLNYALQFAVVGIYTTSTNVFFDNIEIINLGNAHDMSTAVSATSNTIGTGSKSFTLPTGLSYTPGDPVMAENHSDRANRILGTVTSYDTGTGAFVMNGTTTIGSGTFADWYIGPPLVLGLAFNGVIEGRMTNNRISKTFKQLTQNNCLQTSASSETSRVLISNNHCINASMIFSGHDLFILNNHVEGYSYGQAIATGGDTFSHTMVIANNILHGGRGTDTDDTVAGGIESHAIDTVIANNIIYDNDGSGIGNTGSNVLIANNVIYDNGMLSNYDGIQNACLDTSSAWLNAAGTVVIGNRAFNTTGASGTQGYGYSEFNPCAAKTGSIIVGQNNFAGNKLGDVRLEDGSADLRPLPGTRVWGYWRNWTPTVGGTSTPVTQYASYTWAGGRTCVTAEFLTGSAGTVTFTLPVDTVSTANSTLYGNNATATTMIFARVPATSTTASTITIHKYDGSDGAAGVAYLDLNGCYQTSP